MHRIGIIVENDRAEVSSGEMHSIIDRNCLACDECQSQMKLQTDCASPVTKWESGDAKNDTTAATSAGCPVRKSVTFKSWKKGDY
jgi:hypothetical protein